MNKISSWKIFLFGLIIGGAIVYLGNNYQHNSNQTNGNQISTVFEWLPPEGILSPSKNITDSTTCRFKKSFNTFFMAPPAGGNDSNPPERIRYVFADDNEADTVTFINLNTDHPTVKLNTGQGQLTVLDNNADSITMTKDNGSSLVIYRILKKKGLLIYSDSYDNLFGSGPTGTLEMGYCN
ncbi:MAG: hypothetical protein NT149_02450 [Candidatus Gottesmanbacteria bacterium]|nr:hypothetical protein [Candidatus Gottesmanbacteria bacterium]